MAIAEAVYLQSFSSALGFCKTAMNASRLENYTSLRLTHSLRMCLDTPKHRKSRARSFERLRLVSRFNTAMRFHLVGPDCARSLAQTGTMFDCLEPISARSFPTLRQIDNSRAEVVAPKMASQAAAPSTSSTSLNAKKPPGFFLPKSSDFSRCSGLALQAAR